MRDPVLVGRAPRTQFTVALARHDVEIELAQQLRYRVFGLELGAHLPSSALGLDQDPFDPYCDHLLVRDLEANLVVGTYRILPPDRAARLGKLYSDGEFDLSRLASLRPRLVEVGRSCIHPDYRHGAVISLLWAGLAQYMRDGGHEYLMGCASIGMQDGGARAAGIYHALRHTCLSPEEWRVVPHNPVPTLPANGGGNSNLPPLIKGYVRLGAYVCGEPAWDPSFNTADLLMLLVMSRINTRYARHFLGQECLPPSPTS